MAESVDDLFTKAVEARDGGRLNDALASLLQLLAEAPDSPRGRLLLANIYYLSGCAELAAEEVGKLRERYKDRESLKRLLKVLDPSFHEEAKPPTSPDTEPDTPVQEKETKAASVPPPEQSSEKKSSSPPPKQEEEDKDEVLAETDFDFDDLDLLADEEEDR